MNCIMNDCGNSVWVLCDNGQDIWHLNEVMNCCEVVSGQPNMREFETFEEGLAEIPEPYKSKLSEQYGPEEE